MENYKISINDISGNDDIRCDDDIGGDDEIGGLFEIIIENEKNQIVSQFDFDFDEIKRTMYSGDGMKKNYVLSNENKIDNKNKLNIFNFFVDDLMNNRAKGYLNFSSENTERCIHFNDGFMEFKFISRTMMCLFVVKISDELIFEFKKLNNLLSLKFNK